jgi:hypothetical protein
LAVLIVLAMTMAVQPVHADTISATPSNSCDGGETETIRYTHSGFDVEMVYNFTFDESQQLLCVNVKNTGDHPASGGYRTIVDNRGLETPRPELEPGETMSSEHNISPWLNLFDDNHTVSVGARGNNTEFNFTHEINASNPNIPSPEISNISVVRDHQNNSTALRVSLYNPTKRGYVFYTQTETFGTDGVYRAEAPQPNQTESVLLPLDEGPDEVIAGKVRIFHRWDVSNGKYDQKEFMAKPNKSVNSWDVPFDRVPGSVDEFDYHNESAAKYREGYVDDETLPPLQRKVGAALVVLFTTGMLWAWRRRKNR